MCLFLYKHFYREVISKTAGASPQCEHVVRLAQNIGEFVMLLCCILYYHILYQWQQKNIEHFLFPPKCTYEMGYLNVFFPLCQRDSYTDSCFPQLV